MVPVASAAHELPPSAVTRTVPDDPATLTWLASITLRACSVCLVPDACETQVTPPLVVLRIGPPLPAIQAVEAPLLPDRVQARLRAG